MAGSAGRNVPFWFIPWRDVFLLQKMVRDDIAFHGFELLIPQKY